MMETKKRASADSSSQKSSKISKQLGDFVEDDLIHSPGADSSDGDYMLERDYTEAFLKQNRMCAETALEFYNKKHNTNYELVEAMASNAFMDGLFWMHCNFKAKNQMNPADGDCCTKTFFAELSRYNLQPLAVKHCRILKGKTARCSYCCYDCKDSIIEHPVNGFHKGNYDNCKYDLRSRSSSRHSQSSSN